MVMYAQKFLLLCILLIVCPSRADAETLQQRIDNLRILPIHYGANPIAIDNKNILIIKGKIVAGNAWDQDHYMILEQQGNLWQIVRNDAGDSIFRTIPHTGEDSISAVYFMAPKEDVQNDELSDLYLLTITRKYKESPVEHAAAHISLSLLNYDSDELGTLYFRNVQTAISEKEYPNVEAAGYHELGIQLPN